MSPNIFVIFPLLLYLILCSSAEDSCKYVRFSAEHTMCKPPNPSCSLVSKGVTEEEKDLIVRLHNEYRNKVATGKETRGGGLPEAADMLEMTWDDELAEIAQRHAENCVFEHECLECREVAQYVVGQCLFQDEVKQDEGEEKEKDWNLYVSTLTDEVEHFHENKIESFTWPPDGKIYAHFTQMVWSRTFRIGCGWSRYKKEENPEYDQGLYVCNYGPGGNSDDEKVYKKGSHCSSCPKNTCCGEACEEFDITPDYEGLCKIIDEKLPPEGAGPSDSEFIFYCDFFEQEDCDSIDKSDGNWELIETVGGNWIESTVEGGETAILSVPMKVSSGSHCLNITSRIQPTTHGDDSDFTTEITIEGSDMPYTLAGSDAFLEMGYPMDVNDKEDTIKVTLKVSVPDGSPSVYVDIKRTLLSKESCNSS